MRVWLAIGMMASVSCGLRDPGMVSGGGEGPTTGGPNGRSIETFASPLEVIAGGVVTVECVVRRGEEYLADELTRVTVFPPAGAVVPNGEGGFDFSPTGEGLYRVTCSTEDGAVVDPRGVEVEVLPAPAAVVETLLSTEVAQAGEPVEVICDVFDVFGNRLPDERGSGVRVDTGVLIDPAIGAGFVVRGATVGDHEIACEHGNLTDETPAILTVVAGVPGASDTIVDLGSVKPGETITVSCSVTDAFGNPLEGVETDFVVLTADGTAPDDLATTDATFTPTVTGIYYVFCMVPGANAGDETPAVVRVRPGDPCTWVLDVLAQDCYWQGRRLPVDFEVFDFWGNRLDDDEVSVGMSATPSTGIVQDGPGSWIFTLEGDFDLTFSVIGSVDEANCAGLPGYAGTPEVVNIRVDSTGPVLDILPARAAMFTQDDVADTPVAISGSVTDSISNIVSASVNGTDLGADGTLTVIPISLTQTSRWGTTVISGQAEDACGNRSVLAQSYVRSGDTAASGYFAAATVPAVAARAPRGIFAQLNQVVLDDYDRTDLDDLATIGEVILQDQDFNALVPPGFDFVSSYITRACDGGWPWECDYWADVEYLVERPNNSARIIVEGPYIVYLEAIDGGLRFHVHVGDASAGRGFEFPLRLWARDRECVCGLETTIASVDVGGIAYADTIDVSGTMAVTLAGGAPQASAPSLSVSTTGLDFNLSCPGWIDWLCDWISGTLIDLLSDMIEDALADAIRDELPPLVEDMLAGFTLDDGFDIPPPLDMRLEMSSGLDWLVFCGPSAGVPKPAQCPASSPNPGYGQMGLYAQIYPNSRGADIPSSAPGAIRKSGVRPAFSSGDYEFGMGIKDDMFNQILWALWYGGGLDIDANTMADIIGGTGFDGIEMSLFFETPPVAMPGRDGWELQLGIGDAYVDATVDLAALLGGGDGGGGGELHVGLYLSTVMGGTLDINAQNELTVSLDTDPQIYVQVVDIDDAGYQAVMSDVFVEILRLILPNLISSVLSSFPIPEIDLSGIANLPPGTDATWSFTNASIARQTDYYVITGSLQ